MTATTAPAALTPRERQALRALHAHLLREQRPATARELAGHLGLRVPSFAHHLIVRLAAKGYVRLDGGGSRGFSLVGLELAPRYVGESGERLCEAVGGGEA